jgi:hypothetical protein
MHNINIFYHVFCVNNWQELCKEQFADVYKSGLYDRCYKMHIGVVGTKTEIDKFYLWFPQMIKEYTSVNKIEMRNSTENCFEYTTLFWLKEYCDINDTYVLYFHTKGISIPMHSEDRMLAEDWKNCMMHFNILKWQDCIKKLDEGVDCCGICYRKRKNFLGNFWWANSNYIKKLTPVLDYKAVVCRKRIKRFWYESWLFRTCECCEYNPKTHCFYSPNGNYRGERRLLPEEYINKL